MSRVISEDDKYTVINTSWRMEIFCEPGEEVTMRGHRARVVVGKATGKQIGVERLPDKVIVRKLSDLPPGPRGLVTSLAALFDGWEIEDEEKRAANA